MSLDADLSDLSTLVRDLGMLASPEHAENLMPAMTSTAALVKSTWNAKLYNEGHAARTGKSISYDVGTAHDFSLFALTVGPGGVKASTLIAEIGPRTGSGKQAGIVRLIEDGSMHNAPHGYGAASIQEHEGDFEIALAFAEAAAAGRFGL